MKTGVDMVVGKIRGHSVIAHNCTVYQKGEDTGAIAVYPLNLVGPFDSVDAMMAALNEDFKPATAGQGEA